MEKTYSVHEAAKILGICLDSVRRHLRSGKMPGVRIGRQWRVSESQLRNYMGLGVIPADETLTAAKPVQPQVQHPDRTEVVDALLPTAPVRAQITKLVHHAAISANIRPRATQRLLGDLDTLLRQL